VISYTVILERDPDGGYSVWAPDLPGCASQGDTHDEALEAIREAIALYIESLKADGQPIPEPRTSAEGVQVDAA
jgi:predicted RNase H-like HicB family nuclease